MTSNALTLTAYTGTTPVAQTGFEHAEELEYSTLYPGGLFGACSFFVPRDVTAPWSVEVCQRLVVRNGLEMVWEGVIVNIALEVNETAQGMRVTAAGYWGDLLMHRHIVKAWADTRLSEDVWVYVTSSTGADKCDIDRQNRIRFTPKAVSWSATNAAHVRYTALAGQTVKRVKFNWVHFEGAQSWMIGLLNNATSSIVWSTNGTGSGSQDITLATPSQTVTLFFLAEANQTGVDDGSIYGEFFDITVYTETGSINLTEIAKDVRGMVPELSADESLIASNTLDIVPFLSDGLSAADVLIEAAGYGDLTNKHWAVGVRESDLSSDGKPILFAEQQPALTDYDYAIRLDGEELSTFAATQDVTQVINYVYAWYRNKQGYPLLLTPDDNAMLKNDASIALYGRREAVIEVNTTHSGSAAYYGGRLIVSRRDAPWRVSGEIPVRGAIRGKGGQVVPASAIRAGQRVKVENYLNDLSGAGLTFLITGTSYDDATQTCRLSVGVPVNLDVMLAQQRSLVSVRYA
jgi:hypothetical protein